MCGGQPDVQRKGPRLGSESHQHQKAPRPQQRPVLHRRRGRPHLIQAERTQLVIQKKQSGQGGQASDHRHRQIGLPRLQGLILLGLDHQHKGSEGHDLKKYKCGKQVRREKDTHGGAQRHHPEKIEPAALFHMDHVLPAEHRGGHPPRRRKQGHQGVEAPRLELNTQAAEPLHRRRGVGQLRIGPDGQHQQHFHGRGGQNEHIPGLTVPPAQQIGEQAGQHGKKDREQQKTGHPLHLLVLWSQGYAQQQSNDTL